jgi:hypothetical protein
LIFSTRSSMPLYELTSFTLYLLTILVSSFFDV